MEKYRERVILESLNLMCYWEGKKKKSRLMRCITSKHKSCGIDEDLPSDPHRLFHCMASCWSQKKAPHTVCDLKYVTYLHWNCFIKTREKVNLSTSKPGCWHLPDTQDRAGTTHRKIHTRTCHKSLESATPASQGRIKLPQAHSKQVYSKWPS